MTRTRVALALVPLVALTLATQGHAAPTKAPQIMDAKGDSLTTQADTDIVSVLWTTAGKGSGKAYVAKQLVVTMTLAGPPATTPGYTYEVNADSSQCGDVQLTFEPGTPYSDVTGVNGWSSWGTCEDVALIAVKTTGNAIVWSFSLKGQPLKLGTVLSDFRARVDASNPVVPLPSDGLGVPLGLGLLDSATGSGTWKVG
jgi:hypothetical protein